MWEQIRSNRRKSVILVFLMALLLVTLGYVLGEALQAGWGVFGVLVALVIWGVLSAGAYFQGGNIMLALAGAKRVEKEDHPQLFNVVEEMTIASGLGKMPDVYIINDMAPNAFATGRSPDRAAVAVTAGLLRKLNRDQLQGVIAHEIAHVRNRDVLFMTMLGIMAGTITVMSETFVRGLFLGGAARRFSGGRGRGGGGFRGGHPAVMVLALVFVILAPILARLIYMASSRKREYLADASAAVFTRYPEGLAQALDIISGDVRPMTRVNSALAPMFIKNPLQKASVLSLFSTHPPARERVRILRSMAGACSYANYQKVWQQVSGKKAQMPKSALQHDQEAPMREPVADSSGHDPQSKRAQARQAGDVLRKANSFLFLSCVCGLRIKLPPDYKKESVDCPRCKRNIAVPVAQLAALSAAGEAIRGEAEEDAPKHEKPQTMEVTKASEGWTSFKCTCGNTMNLSPAFLATHTQCPSCRQHIRVKTG